MELSKAKRGTIYVLDDQTRDLYFIIDTPDGKKQIRMPLTGSSMAGAAILNNQLINIPDCYKDSRFDPTMDKRTGFHTTQMLCVPVTVSDGQPIGAIQIINTDNGMSFTDADVELLRNFQLFVQIAILNDKAQAASEHAQQLAKHAISAATKMSWTEGQHELIKVYFDKICTAMDADYVALTMPHAMSENKLLRYDNEHSKPYPVLLNPGTGTYSVSKSHKFLNVAILGIGTQLPLITEAVCMADYPNA